MPPPFSLVDATQRALYVVPALGLQLRALSVSRRPPDFGAGAAAAALSARSSALIDAATGMYGRLSFLSPTGDLVSLVGEPARRLAGRSGAYGRVGVGVGEGEGEGDGGVRPPSDERLAEDDEDEMPASSDSLSSSLAGMVVGEWEAAALLLRRVNVSLRPPLLAGKAAFAALSAPGTGTTEAAVAAVPLSLPGDEIED